MGTTATVLADSIHHLSQGSRRLTTFQVRFQRFALPELSVHRWFSKNTASSRAIPVEKLIREAQEDPALFVHWGCNKPGMVATEELSPAKIGEAKAAWLAARDAAVLHAQRLLSLGLHKQAANRVLEPYLHTTVILSATDLANFYKLRLAPDAQPEMQALAGAMWEAQQASTPVDRTDLKGIDRWHLPMIGDDERHALMSAAIKVCVARMARVSYLTQDGRRDFNADVALHDRLAQSGHWSCFEHAATPFKQTWWRRLCGHDDRQSNFSGWTQYRKKFANEHPYTPGQVEP